MRGAMATKLSAGLAALACAALALSACRAVDPAPGARSASDPAPGRVLFVGNSFTFYNNGLHNHYRAMVRERDGAAGQIRALTLSGGKLGEHRAGLRQRLVEQRWDAVVLQGHSNAPLTDPATFDRDVGRYCDLIRAHGARPLLFMTWAYTGRPEMTGALQQLYCGAGARADAAVVPVGLAFEELAGLHPEIDLRLADRKHPTPAGSYLAACTLFAVLRDESPIGLAYTAGLPETLVSALQRTAWQTVQDFKARPR